MLSVFNACQSGRLFASWKLCKKNGPITRETRETLLHSASVKGGVFIQRLNTLNHLHSHHMQSLCLLKQLPHQNRRFKIRQFMLHTRWWHLVEMLYCSVTQWTSERNGLELLEYCSRTGSPLNSIYSEDCSQLAMSEFTVWRGKALLFLLCCKIAWMFVFW